MKWKIVIGVLFSALFLWLAARGAKVVVNDLGGSVDGSGGSTSAAEAVAKEIIKALGEAAKGCVMVLQVQC